MPKRVRLILNPGVTDALSRTVGEAHRRTTGFVNARARETRRQFQGRFGCVAMDEAHCLSAVRTLAFSRRMRSIRPYPARAKLRAAPGEWPWSSVRAHLAASDDALVRVQPLLAIAPRFAELLEMSWSERAELAGFEPLGANGRPLGSPAFLAAAEARLGRAPAAVRMARVRRLRMQSPQSPALTPPPAAPPAPPGGLPPPRLP